MNHRFFPWQWGARSLVGLCLLGSPALGQPDLPPPAPADGQELAPERSRVLSDPLGTATSIVDAEVNLASTLDEFEALALTNHPGLSEAMSSVAAAQGRAWQAGLMPNPKYDFFSPQMAGDQSQYANQLSQEIVTGRKLKLDRAAVCQEVQQAELTYIRTRYEILARVRGNFYQALAEQQRILVLDRLVELLDQSRKAAQQLQDAGLGTKTDVLLLEIEVQNAEVNRQNARTQYRVARKRLAAAAGMPQAVVGEIHGKLAARGPEFDLDLAVYELTRNSQLQSAAVEISRSQVLLQRARAQPIPNITVSGGYQHQVSAPHDMGIFGVSIPLPTWNRNQGGIAEAEANIARAQAGYQRLNTELADRLAELFGQYQTSVQLVERYEKEILPRAKEAREIVKSGYEQGEFDFLRVLQSQRTLVDSYLGYINAQEQRWRALAELASILQRDDFP